MSLYGPPILNESQALSIFSFNPPQTCMVVPNRAGVSILVADSGPETFVGTLTLVVPDTRVQNDMTYEVFCRVTDIQGNETLNFTTFLVPGKDYHKYLRATHNHAIGVFTLATTYRGVPYDVMSLCMWYSRWVLINCN